MKIGVKIMPRDVVLDTQGRTVLGTLVRSGRNVENCRVGRFVELEFDTSDEKQALDQAKEMAEFVLHNPLTEQFSLEVL